MDDIQVNYGPSSLMPRYTEISSNGEILFQSDSVPTFVNENYLRLYEPVTARAEMNFGHRTSDHYRTFGIPDRFENPGMYNFNSLDAMKLFLYNFPDWWQDFGKPDSNEFYRTSNQEYGRHKPLTHHMPTIYRTKSRAFTQVNNTPKIDQERFLYLIIQGNEYWWKLSQPWF